MDCKDFVVFPGDRDRLISSIPSDWSPIVSVISYDVSVSIAALDNCGNQSLLSRLDM